MTSLHEQASAVNISNSYFKFNPIVALLLTIFILFCSAAFSTNAFAEDVIKITGVLRASNHSIKSGGNTVIYGGVTGPLANCNAGFDSDSFCNNCNLGTEVACNRRRIHGGLILRINFEVTGDIEGELELGTGTNTPFDGAIHDKSTGTLKKGDAGFVEVEWGEICDLMISDNSCETGFGDDDVSQTFVLSLSDSFEAGKSVSFKIKILDPGVTGSATSNDLIACADSLSPPDGVDGVCRFTAHPGDQKVYLDHNIAEPICENLSSGDYKAVRFYYVDLTGGTGSFLDASYGSTNYADMPLDGDCNIEGEWILDGLENGRLYGFRSSLIDMAENNVFLNDYNVDGAEAISTAFPTCQDGMAAGDDTACIFTATPGEVVGLLPEDFNCFIATAAYGTGFESKIFTFRQFRNQILLKTDWGKKFVSLYYQIGPKAAQWISDKPLVRSLTRIALYPAWAFSWFSIYYGLWGAIIVSAFAVFSFFHFANILRARRLSLSKRVKP